MGASGIKRKMTPLLFCIIPGPQSVDMLKSDELLDNRI